MVSPVPSLIELLKLSAPTELKRLQAAHPASMDLFSTVREFGPATTTADRAALVATLTSGIATTAAELDAIAAQVRQTMRRVANIRFAGALIAIVSGGITAVLSLVASNQIVQAMTALIAMAGGITTAIADQFEKSPSGLRTASVEEYGKLVEARASLETVRLQLQRDNLLPLGDDDLAKVAEQMNQFALTALRWKLAGS